MFTPTAICRVAILAFFACYVPHLGAQVVYPPETHATPIPAIKFSPQDLRFTRRGEDLYVTTLGIPTKEVVIKSLSTQSPLVTADPKEITLLGYPTPLTWHRNDQGLTIELPKDLANKSTLSFKISVLPTNDGIDPTTLVAFQVIAPGTSPVARHYSAILR